MPLNEKEEALLAKSEEALELLYDYFPFVVFQSNNYYLIMIIIYKLRLLM